MSSTTERPLRWTRNRGGIINVYLLLPFLLDADTRRIDAAGEQSGVLKSWMLSGRDEPQPQGYLWLEVAKGDSFLNFGLRRPGVETRKREMRVVHQERLLPGLIE